MAEKKNGLPLAREGRSNRNLPGHLDRIRASFGTQKCKNVPPATPKIGAMGVEAYYPGPAPRSNIKNIYRTGPGRDGLSVEQITCKSFGASGTMWPQQSEERGNPTMMNERILRISEVIETTGLSRSSLYDAIHAGLFPRQIKLTRRCVGWRLSDIQAWIASRATTN